MEVEKPRLRLKLCSYFLALASAWVMLAMASILSHRDSHEETSSWIYGPDTPLMNSAFLDAIVGTGTATVIALLAVAVFVKEFIFRKQVKQRIVLNLTILIAASLAFRERLMPELM